MGSSKVKSKRNPTLKKNEFKRRETTKVLLRIRRKMAILSGVTSVDNTLLASCRLTYGDVVHERRKLFILCGTEMNGEASRYNK